MEEGSHLQNYISVHNIIYLKAIPCSDASTRRFRLQGRQAGESTSYVLLRIALRMSLLSIVAHELPVGLQIHCPMDHNLLYTGNIEPMTERGTPAATLPGGGLCYSSNFQWMGSNNK